MDIRRYQAMFHATGNIIPGLGLFLAPSYVVSQHCSNTDECVIPVCNISHIILEWNPRGQVAPQVIVTNVATKQTDKGVAPQSPLEESATTSAR